MTLNRLFFTAALPAILTSLTVSPAWAQDSTDVTIDMERAGPVTTSGEGGDVTIVTGGSVVLTQSGAAVTVDSDNVLSNSGIISAEDVNDAIGVNLIGGNNRSFIQAGQISINESFVAEDTDNDGTVDGPFAEGSGRTGILISGASPFAGNVEQQSMASTMVEGNDSFGIRLEATSSLLGNLDLGGVVSTIGANAVGVGLEGQVIGNLALSGSITTTGENATAVRVSNDVDGQIRHTGQIVNTGYRFAQRLPITQRNLLDAEDQLQAGAAISVTGNVTNGIFFEAAPITTTDPDTGEVTTTGLARSAVSQFGSAPALIIDGQGTPIAIGVVAAVTDPTADGFEADQQFAFINQGDLVAGGVNNDINATVFETRDVTLEGGILNTGTLSASTFRSGNTGTDDVNGQTGTAQVIIIGDNVIADRINNQGLILASVSESTEEVFEDRSNIIAPRFIRAVAIDIAESAEVSSFTNTSSISAVISGRTGEAVAILDASGTLTEINNSGVIQSIASSSDSTGQEATDFNLVAFDLSANTTGITFDQFTSEGSTITPVTSGDILLGSGDDVVDIRSGVVNGNIAFGAGADQLSLSGASSLTGSVTDSDGNLVLSLAGGSTLTQITTDNVDVVSASLDGTSTFRPTIDGVSGDVSTLVASESVTLANGASVAPTLLNVVGVENSVFPVISAQNLTIEGDLDTLSSAVSPFLYDTAFALDPNDPNTLVVTLDLRSTDQLGLDGAQSAVFTSAFEALGTNSELASALININDGTQFNQAFNQLLPEFSAAGRQFILANVDGATGAVGTHLDAARRSPDRPGGIWLEEFAYFADRELSGLSEQYRGFGFGFTGGIDTAWGPFHALGVNVGFASTEIEDVVGVDEPLNVVTLQAGLYAGYATGNLGIEAYAGGGYNDFEATRQVEIGNFNSRADGDWSGTHINGSLRAGYDLDISDRIWLRPTISVDYLSLTENAYTESGDPGIALSIDDRTVASASATAMLNIGTSFQGRRTWIRPALRAGYRTDFLNDSVITTGRFVGQTTPFSIAGAEFPDNGFLLGLTLAAGSEYSSFALDLDSDIRDGFIRHTGRIVFRLLF